MPQKWEYPHTLFNVSDSLSPPLKFHSRSIPIARYKSNPIIISLSEKLFSSKRLKSASSPTPVPENI